jgi:tetratricopeptide (TPR) repeat protein
LIWLLLLAWGPLTDGKIAVGNLDAQIAGLAGHPGERARLLLTRAQYLGSPADYDLALALVPPQDRELRGEVEAALHQFRLALADARSAGAGDLLASVQQAMGDEEMALPFRSKRAGRDLQSLGELAVLEGVLGRFSEAEQHFAEAQASYHDVSPFGPAWLEFQWGLLEERQGRLAEALQHYEEAHRLLPDYAPATGHLAGALAMSGDRLRAIRLLTPLADRMEDPEYAAELLALQPDEQLRARATRRFDALVKKHPEAYADHAARFFLGRARAVELARRNLDNRHTDEAYALLIDALISVNQDACGVADKAWQQRPHAGAQLQVAVAKAFSRCGKLSQAEKVLTAPSPPPTTPRR